jgi:hypothetical protein
MKNNIIFDNIDFSYGGTVFLNDVHNSILSNNTIAENISSQNSGSIYISGGSSDVSIFNNIITYNNQYGLYVTTSTNISVNYNCIFGNISGDIYGIAPGNGNIYVAPQFLSPENEDYSLLGSSPCIDTGDPSSPYDPDSTRADMGALYFDQTYRILNFHLIDPANDTVVVDTIQAFIWHSTEDIDSGYVVSYNLIWDDDPTFNYPDSTGTQPDTIYVLSDSLNRSTRYYWRVLASNGHAVPIYSDETWNFYIDGYPTSPQILGPENGTEADSSTYLSWIIGNDPDPMDTVTYTLQADDDTLFVSPEIDVSGITDSGVILDEAVAVQLGDLPGFENLQVGQVYYWRVRSNDLFGLSSAFTDGSTYFSLGENINDPPHPPDSGFSPSNYEEVISLTPTITWNAASDPDPDDPPSTLQYIFWLFSDTSTGCGFEYWDTTAAGIVQVTVADTMPDNCLWIYFVKTVDDEGLESGWSTMQHFWTNHYNYPPEPFPLYSPDPDHTRVVMYTEFVWGNTVDLDPMATFAFKLEYSPDSLFGGSVSAVEALSDTSLTLATDSLMQTGQDLYWRILAIDDDSLSRIGGIPEEVRYLRILPAGDANSSGQTNGLDVVYLVAYFKGEVPAPDPLLAGDANGSCSTNGLDVTYLVNYFKGGLAPIRPDCWQTLTRKGLENKIDYDK